MSVHHAFFEPLESRQLLATFLVDNTNDSGAGSLRDAIEQANAAGGADIVEFATGLNNGTITLAGTELSITDDLTINGPGADLLTVSGNNLSRVFHNSGTTTISGLTITGGNAGDGGGISNQGTLTLNNSTVSGNAATYEGGGILQDGGTLTLNNSTISGNNASDSGGGIDNVGGTLTLNNSTISENTANYGGGLFNAFSATATLNNSTISGNTANFGGGIYNNFTLTLNNSTISGNNADGGSGIYHSSGTLMLANSTISGNTASNFGGGIYIDLGTAAITSSILAGNTAGGLPSEIIGTLEAGSTNNLIQDAATAGGLSNGVGGNLVGVDPLLAPLANYGGPTQTHALLDGSPAIGAGINPLSFTTDQRGVLFARGSAVDIGAYQQQSLALIVDALGDVVDGNFGPGELSLREAIAAAGPNPGNDTVAFTTSLNGGTITLAGTELSLLGDLTINGPGADLLTVSGNNLSRVFHNSGTTTISGLTITGGNAGGGGGISNQGTLTLNNSTVSGNTATLQGGGIVGDGGTLTLNNSTISGNDADSGSGIYNLSGTLTLTNSTISANTASDSGGGILQEGGTLTLNNSTISGNTANNGGGIYNAFSGTATLNNSTISGNTASNSGGGIYNDGDGTLTLNNSTISGNTASFGGGIYNNFTLTLNNSTISGNNADGGSGIYHSSGTLTLNNSTISGNTASNFGGGIYIDLGTAAITSSILAGNTAGGLPSEIIGTLEAGSTNNLIQDAATAGGLVHGVDGNIVGVDPLLGPLVNNGGPTLTHRPMPGSPALNAGGNPLSFTTDQRGLPRIRGLGIDIGSLESNPVPTIASLTPSASSFGLGQTVTLTASTVVDADGTIARVDFYRDANNNGVAEVGELIGTDTSATGGYTAAFPVPEGFTLGTATFLAVATDNDEGKSTHASGSVTVTDAISLGSPAGAANSINVHRVVSVDTLGQVLVFRQGWTYENLQEKTGAPDAIGTAVIWTDPKDGLTYVAAPSAQGLILFTRAASGTWSFRNLTTETGAIASPVSDLTQFTSVRQRIVVVAGITAGGKVVAFQQTLTTAPGGGPAFKFVNISADLESQGQATPDLTGLTSYVPSWDTWHLAGVDTLGRIQSIWINTNNPAFIKWRTNNLSTITGAPAITGQLAVTLTTWGGINLTGLDSSGNMLTTWWVPRFAGQWAVSNLTTLYGGPQLVGGNLTSYTTPWGGINYVGLDAGGTVRVYWWIPRFVGQWAISPLLPSGTPSTSIPTGALTSSASAAGTLNVYGTNSTGNVLHMAWQPGAGNVWNIEDLSDIAVEV